jgi:hypothetical protein
MTLCPVGTHFEMQRLFHSLLLLVLLWDLTDCDDFACWDPFTIEGSHFVTYLIRQLHLHGRIKLETSWLKVLKDSLEDIKTSHQSQAVSRLLLFPGTTTILCFCVFRF